MTFNLMDPFSHQLANLISGPRYPEHFFIFSKYTYRDIYSLSTAIQKTYFSSGNEETICLCVEDKGIVAAAFLAAITYPVTLVIPYSFSESALSDMYQTVPFSKAITDDPGIAFPPDIETYVMDARQMLKTDFSPGVLRSPDSIFLKLFTGGSTGTPKIWSKTIRNMFGEAFFLSEKFTLSAADRFISTVPPIHIYGLLFTVLAPLVSSAGVLDGMFSFPHEIYRAIMEKQPTVLVSIPIHYKMLNDRLVQKKALRLAFSSAGKLNEGDSEVFFEQTGLGITEIYGSTESGGIATRCSTQSPYFTFNEGVDARIEADQLLIRSDFVSPEIDRDDDGFIDTGDQARFADNGSFTLMGRADRIVKVAGKRVDLEEVKNKIILLENVADAVVISIDSRGGRENEIWALVSGNVEPQELRRQIIAVLEPWAVPRRIRVVDHIPVSPTGKYDKKEIEVFFNNL
jgi:acyl-coenzyme A synthetase/AMP-(fatty) acid ligase